MMLPARVLPSNAPPLLDGDALQSASRVLQEHSGNRQISDLAFVETDYEQKYSGVTLFNENSYELQIQPPQPQHHLQQQQLTHHLHYHRPQHRHHTLRHGQHYATNPYLARLHDPKAVVEAEFLYRRFKQSDSYVKYRNRQSKGDKNEEQKWPDHLEKAFFRGNSSYI
jgi:hypothetical protein